MRRVASSSLLESIDYMDPTRSHELLPSQRIQARKQDRRRARAVVFGLLMLATLIVLVAY